MSVLTVQEFLIEFDAALQKYFSSHEMQVFLNTPKSFKANVLLNEGIFIAVRYNARNERTDFALIKNKQRIFGYNNLKDWHYHPYENPSEHIPCEKPTIDKVLLEMKKVVEITNAD
jgi:hypothetical protein